MLAAQPQPHTVRLKCTYIAVYAVTRAQQYLRVTGSTAQPVPYLTDLQFCPKHTSVPARLTLTLTTLICIWCDVFCSATFRSICCRVLPVVIIVSSGRSRFRIPVRCCYQRSLEAKRRAVLYNRPRQLAFRNSVMYHSVV